MRCLILLLIVVMTSGCSIIGNLDQLFALKTYSAEKDAQRRQIERTNASYDKLKADYQAGRLVIGATATSIQDAYGLPILNIPHPDGTSHWLYRHDIWYKDTDKIYLFFNEQQQLTEIKLEEKSTGLPK